MFSKKEPLFRVKKVTLNSGEEQFFPQCKESMLGGYNTIMEINGKKLITSSELSTEDVGTDTLEEANRILASYKAKLKEETSKLVKYEEYYTEEI